MHFPSIDSVLFSSIINPVHGDVVIVNIYDMFRYLVHLKMWIVTDFAAHGSFVALVSILSVAHSKNHRSMSHGENGGCQSNPSIGAVINLSFSKIL